MLEIQVPPIEAAALLGAVAALLTLLPQQVIHEVVLYYRQARRSNAMTLGLRDPILRSETSAEGQAQFVRGLLQLIAEQELAGRKALQAIEAHGSSLGLDLAAKRSRSIERSEHERLDRSGHVTTPRNPHISHPGAD